MRHGALSAAWRYIIMPMARVVTMDEHGWPPESPCSGHPLMIYFVSLAGHAHSCLGPLHWLLSLFHLQYHFLRPSVHTPSHDSLSQCSILYFIQVFIFYRGFYLKGFCSFLFLVYFLFFLQNVHLVRANIISVFSNLSPAPSKISSR